ncbi:MAG TPA: hypothetical protein VG455_11045, partial [Acidimicrobiales bacterium]|nr:hypothetical protein [Acidimicrobiales bacterium]
ARRVSPRREGRDARERDERRCGEPGGFPEAPATSSSSSDHGSRRHDHTASTDDAAALPHHDDGHRNSHLDDQR